jgi:hypothetical protein
MSAPQSRYYAVESGRPESSAQLRDLTFIEPPAKHLTIGIEQLVRPAIAQLSLHSVSRLCLVPVVVIIKSALQRVAMDAAIGKILTSAGAATPTLNLSDAVLFQQGRRKYSLEKILATVYLIKIVDRCRDVGMPIEHLPDLEFDLDDDVSLLPVAPTFQRGGMNTHGHSPANRRRKLEGTAERADDKSRKIDLLLPEAPIMLVMAVD